MTNETYVLEKNINEWVRKLNPYDKYPDGYIDDFIYWMRKNYAGNDYQYPARKIQNLFEKWKNLEIDMRDNPGNPPYVWDYSDLRKIAGKIELGRLDLGEKSNDWLALYYLNGATGPLSKNEIAVDAVKKAGREILDRDMGKQKYFFMYSSVDHYYQKGGPAPQQDNKKDYQSFLKDLKNTLSDVLAGVPNAKQIKKALAPIFEEAYEKGKRSLSQALKDAKKLLKALKGATWDASSVVLATMQPPLAEVGNWAGQMQYSPPPDDLTVTDLPKGANKTLAKMLGWVMYQRTRGGG